MSNQASRFNTGKIDLALLPAAACQEEARVWMMGEEKYGRDNWKKLWGDQTITVVMASLLRHAFSILDGETVDSESGLDHAAHIRCNAAMIIEYNKKAQGLGKSRSERMEADNKAWEAIVHRKGKEKEYDTDGKEIVERHVGGDYTVADVERFMDGTNTFYERRVPRNATGADKPTTTGLCAPALPYPPPSKSGS